MICLGSLMAFGSLMVGWKLMGLVKAEKILMDSDLVGGSGLRLGSDLSSGMWTNLGLMMVNYLAGSSARLA